MSHYDPTFCMKVCGPDVCCPERYDLSKFPNPTGSGGLTGAGWRLCLRHQTLQQFFHRRNLLNRSWDRNRGSHTRQQSSEQILHLMRSRLRLGNRRHPYLLDDVVRVTYYIGWINRIRTMLTDPSNFWVCATLPDSASIHNISDRSFGWYTVQVPPQLTTTMSCYKAIAN